MDKFDEICVWDAVVCAWYVFRQYMASDAVLKSSLVENAMQAMMSEQEQYNQRRCRLVQRLPYVALPP